MKNFFYIYFFVISFSMFGRHLYRFGIKKRTLQQVIYCFIYKIETCVDILRDLEKNISFEEKYASFLSESIFK